MKVLIINSSDLQTKILERLMKKLGFYVNNAPNAEKGLGHLKKSQADVILLAYYLPDLMALDFLKRAVDLRLLTKTKVLVLGGNADEEDPVMSIANGADDFISEPLYLEELLLKLGSFTGHYFSDDVLQTLKAEVKKIRKEFSGEEKNYAHLWLRYDKETGFGKSYASSLFIRIFHISELAESLSNEQFTLLLNTLFHEISKIVYHSRGCVHYIRGGSIFVSFGAPLVYDNDTLNAALCAFRVQKFIDAFNSRKESYLKEDIRLSIGISTGKIINTSIYATKRTSATILGNPVEKASGLAYLARESGAKILTDTETKEVIASYGKFREMDFTNYQCLCSVYNLHNIYELQEINEKEILQLPNIENQPGSPTVIDEEEYDKL